MKILLILSLSLLFVCALLVILYPLSRSKKAYFLILPLSLLTAWAYWHWGGLSDWITFLQQEEKKKQIQAILQSFKSKDELIARFKARLKQDPRRAEGWYLLGRLYASQASWPLAVKAFKKAWELKPQDEKISVNYALSLWQLNEQQFNVAIRNLLKAVLQRNPKQPDALAMLAQDAYQTKHYRKAREYWQQLLNMLPKENGEAKMIQKAIAKTRIQEENSG